ncbi:hypothetical protein [Streptomyces sp. NPDC048242]|uniref:hypothetical protein n=1 Tax=Streptomyces sp. NPDC048242 TaxID=3155026 RepID=UPI003426F486
MTTRLLPRAEVIARFLRRPHPVREPLARELGGTVVQLLGPGTTVPTWTASPEVLADALDGALQKDTRQHLAGESTARTVILTVLAAAGYSPAAAEDLLARAFREPHRPPTNGDFLESLAGGHALVVEAGHRELVGECQCGRVLGSTTGSCDYLAGLWERHTLTEVTSG